MRHLSLTATNLLLPLVAMTSTTVLVDAITTTVSIARTSIPVHDDELRRRHGGTVLDNPRVCCRGSGFECRCIIPPNTNGDDPCCRECSQFAGCV